jgi:uncharacterized phage protein (TIGR01671 family)
MREILFRGKRLDNGEWIEGCYLDRNNIGIFFDDTDEEDCKVYIFSVDSSTIGQYTGLKDKNGAKIFEGDIVRYKKAERFSDSDEICNAEIIHDRVEFIKFENGKFSPLPYCDICDDYWYSHGAFDFEIIGNIHDDQQNFWRNMHERNSV